MNSPKACARHAFGAFGVPAQVILLSKVNDCSCGTAIERYWVRLISVEISIIYIALRFLGFIRSAEKRKTSRGSNL